MPVALKLVYHFRALKETGQDQKWDGVEFLSSTLYLKAGYRRRATTLGPHTQQIQQEERGRTPVSFSILIEKGKGGRCWKDTRC